MKFYDREQELELLQQNYIASEKQSKFTVMIGRRRIGKTSLIIKSGEQNPPLLYLFVSRDNEHVLVHRMQKISEETLGIKMLGNAENFAQLFEQLMIYSQQNHLTLVLDEFQNFVNINASIPSQIQDIWDRLHQNAKMNLIVCGSVYNMMTRIFENGDQPLYGRKDCKINLKPFKTKVLKNILSDHNPNYTPEDLLCLYAITGGVAKYVSQLIDAQAVTRNKMLDYVCNDGSPFLSEGNELIMSEFGRDYTNYLSIIQLIAQGRTSQVEIDSIIGKNTGSYLNNLATEYNFIEKSLPMFAKPNSRGIRWKLNDNFLRFWCRFILSNQNLIEMGRNDILRKLIERDYEQYSGLALEQYFRQKFAEEETITAIGSYWDRKGENEIDLIAINNLDHTATIAEIKRNPEKYKESILQAKASTIAPHLKGYQTKIIGLSLNDM